MGDRERRAGRLRRRLDEDRALDDTLDHLLEILDAGTGPSASPRPRRRRDEFRPLIRYHLHRPPGWTGGAEAREGT